VEAVNLTKSPYKAIVMLHTGTAKQGSTFCFGIIFIPDRDSDISRILQNFIEKIQKNWSNLKPDV
jgi:hypothetical protein